MCHIFSMTTKKTSYNLDKYAALIDYFLSNSFIDWFDSDFLCKEFMEN